MFPLNHEISLIKATALRCLSLSLLVSSINVATAQPEDSIVHIDPPNWWVGMHNKQIELLLNADNLAFPITEYDIKLSGKQVKIESVTVPEASQYLLINLVISQAAPAQTLTFLLTHPNSHKVKVTYELLARAEGAAKRVGFNAKDVIYLIAPDRFANGDPSNDSVDSMLETVNRDDKGGRHGGDIQGMIDHLEYIADMGFTQIWTMPLLENDMERYSYHGYSTTDFFQIDPRFGSNSLYKAFVSEAREQGIGVIKDVILNHMGSNHPWMSNMPAVDWINHGTEFVPTTHTREALHDPHGVQSDIDDFARGWFVDTMPDMNQQNPHMATYLTQYAIWWVEYAGLSGLRVDTYSYSDKAFLSAWTQAVMAEYPNLNIVGEEWSVNPAITAYWQAGSPRYDDYQSALPSVMDFPLQVALGQALVDEDTWATGLRKIYDSLASDFLYGDPYNLVVFADNHDMNRIMPQLNNDETKFMMAMKFLLTTRGIPQIFYGTEFGMTDNGGGDHGLLRADFPGGWQGDRVNAFTGKGLDSQQQRIQQTLRKLLNWRKQTPAITEGKLTQYAPRDGIYVYFRHIDTHAKKQTIMVVLNKNSNNIDLSLTRFSQMLPLENSSATLVDIESNASFRLDQSLTLDANSVSIFELQPSAPTSNTNK